MTCFSPEIYPAFRELTTFCPLLVCIPLEICGVTHQLQDFKLGFRPVVRSQYPRMAISLDHVWTDPSGDDSTFLFKLFGSAAIPKRNH